MTFYLPVEPVDEDVKQELLDAFTQFRDESEILLLRLEQGPDKQELILALRFLFEGLQFNAVKVDWQIIDEALAKTVSLMDKVVAWQTWPKTLSDFLLLLIDKVFSLQKDFAEHARIDLRKAQQVIVALERLLEVQTVTSFSANLRDMIDSFCADFDSPEGSPAQVFDPDKSEVQSISPPTRHEAAQDIPYAGNPVLDARAWIAREFSSLPIATIHNIAARTTCKAHSEQYDVLELALAMNFIAGEPINSIDLALGISFRDIALAEIPHIIHKAERLNDAEFAQIQEHPLKSASLLRLFSQSEVAAQIVLEHHERMNGSGYPFGLRGEHISEAGKLVAIVDSYNGMVKARAYRRVTKGMLRAISEINASVDTLYDARWVKIFNTCVRLYWRPMTGQAEAG